ncbi:hypothetical protein MASR2M52_00870 [Pedobacter sp.]
MTTGLVLHALTYIIMKRFSKFAFVFILVPFSVYAQQETPIDSLKQVQLSSVVIVGQQHVANKKVKVLSSLDSYLESNSAINMIKRGAYAWEPLLNGMATERSVVTIDGMRIYGACTDKMDPVTSYVEITNLSRANIHSGQSGAATGATIAGSVDLVRRQSGFGNKAFRGSIFSGIETSNLQKIAGSALQYSSEKIFTDVDITYRDANNYKAGGGKEVLYSQFTKYNLSAISGYKIDPHQQLTASIIYDRALNVGYPALPMDVSLAKALITSVQYDRHLGTVADDWQTKLYYNEVAHIMDDTKRPIVPIRMDMPGWTKTAGYYSKLSGKLSHHTWTANLSGHYNKSVAEMTMFSNDPNEKDMFMLTWPGLQTLYNGLFLEDKFHINEHWDALFTLGSALHYNYVESNFGYESLKIFYPQMQRSKARWLKNVAIKMNCNKQKWQLSFGTGYGERAPSVAEGYGFYLFNSADKYDYMGNPHMVNEKSLEFNASASFTTPMFFIKAQTDYFRIFNYIIGISRPDYIPMTIGANGIKIYGQLPAATIFNASVLFGSPIADGLQWTGKMIYRKGSSGNLNLPQIQPFGYGATLIYQYQKYIAEIGMDGALAQTKYSPAFGETPARAYTVFNIAVAKQFDFAKQKLVLKAGAENLLDRYYSTFADWNRVPRMGRNVFVNVVYGF